MDCAELNGNLPTKSPDYDFADFHDYREVELLLASCFERFIESDDVPTNPCCSV
jgi:hypothetical protein